MLLLRSFYRFILLSLALLGLFVSSVHAAIVSADDPVFGVDSVTIDDAGLEWLDLTKSTNRSYNEVLGQFGSDGDFEGWRYATKSEVEGLYISAGAAAPFANGVQGNDVTWIADLQGLWGITTAPDSLLDPGSIAITNNREDFVTIYTAALAIDFLQTDDDYAYSQFRARSVDYKRTNLGSALVRADPIPAVPIPAAVWLFGTALIGVVGFGKRKARIAA